MAKYQIWVKAEIELDIEAKDEREAERIAEDKWYKALQHDGEFKIDDVYCYEED